MTVLFLESFTVGKKSDEVFFKDIAVLTTKREIRQYESSMIIFDLFSYDHIFAGVFLCVLSIF